MKHIISTTAFPLKERELHLHNPPSSSIPSVPRLQGGKETCLPWGQVRCCRDSLCSSNIPCAPLHCPVSRTVPWGLCISSDPRRLGPTYLVHLSLLLTVMTSEATCPQWYSHHHTARPPPCGSHLNCVEPRTHPTCGGESETRASSSNVCQTFSSGQQGVRKVLLAAGKMGAHAQKSSHFLLFFWD